jgi:tetratricopeptide (TPR) repeat protein/nicotinamide riboside transporter PnuC
MRRKYFALIPGLIALVVYSLTTCRSVWIGDSGEFALALDSFGICHPPGYPLFTLLGRVSVQAMPFLRPILACGMFNILVASAAVVVLYLIFDRKLGSWLASILSLLFAFSPVFWAETSGVEVYALNVLLIGLTFLVLQGIHTWKWPMAAYLFGLSLTNHPSALSMVPVLLYMFIREKQHRRLRILPVLGMLIGIAGTVYLYMLVRSHSDPISDWGNPETLTGLIDHMTLKQYSGWVHNSFEGFFVSVRLFVTTLLISWWWIGAVATISGAIAGWKVARSETIMALLILISSLLLASSHQAVNYEPFYLPPMFASLVLIGNNFIWLLRKNLHRLVIGGATAFAFACVLGLLAFNYKQMDRSDFTLAEDYGKLILDTADRGILFTAGDINSFPALYLRYVEGYKQDVEVYDRSIRRQALVDRASEIARRTFDDYYLAREAVLNSGEGRMFLAKNHYVSEPAWLGTQVELFSCGILYAAGEKPSTCLPVPEYPPDYDPGDPLARSLLVNLDLARGEEALESVPPDSAAMLEAYRMAIHRMGCEPRAVLPNQIGIYFRQVGLPEMALEAYGFSLDRPLITPQQRRDIRYNISNIYKDKGNADYRAGDLESAVAAYIEASEYDPDNPKLLRNIGLIYLRDLSKPEEALRYLEKYLEHNPSDTEVGNLVRSSRP